LRLYRRDRIASHAQAVPPPDFSTWNPWHRITSVDLQ
jgi:hypothetical protein